MNETGVRWHICMIWVGGRAVMHFLTSLILLVRCGMIEAQLLILPLLLLFVLRTAVRCEQHQYPVVDLLHLR